MKSIFIFFLITINLQAFAQQVTVVDKKHFKLDSTAFSVAGMKYIRKINEPFVAGGDAKYARKADISFQLKNARSISVRFGDSLDIQHWLNFKQTEPEYYTFLDYVSKSGEQTTYSYTLTGHPGEEYDCIVTSVVMDKKKYFVMVDANTEDLREALDLILDLQGIVR